MPPSVHILLDYFCPVQQRSDTLYVSYGLAINQPRRDYALALEPVYGIANLFLDHYSDLGADVISWLFCSGDAISSLAWGLDKILPGIGELFFG